MLGTDRSGRESGVRELVRIRIGHPDRKGADGLLDHRRHQGGEGGGVDASREKEPEWDVRHQMAAHGGRETLAHDARVLLQRHGRLVDGSGNAPVPALS